MSSFKQPELHKKIILAQQTKNQSFKIKRIIALLIICSNSLLGRSQILTDQPTFTRQDTLRGSITPERAWWDLTYYHLEVAVFPDSKTIQGKNTVRYRVLEPYQVLQIDLQAPLKITKVVQNDMELEVQKEGHAHFIKLHLTQNTGDQNSLEIYYEGAPRKAKRAPWDGGFSWKTDHNGKPFIATSCQGLGASVWWPCKDHMYDEVDSMDLSVTVPKGLMDVSNGRLKKVEERDSTSTFHWTVKNPINNYGVNINIGDYVNFSEVYPGENGPLDMDYWVLRDHLEQARKQFKQAPKMMEAFEYWFGPYPFYEDSFKLVEVPYLGMEHQSSVTYGNQFKNGYLGMDLSGTGWGLKFDFIIVHEAGHEWFANNITYKDSADMWIHEGFTAYSECLFLEYYFGKEAGADYVIGTRQNIQNDKPIIGAYHVNSEGSGDMYYKGSNMLHTLRQLIEDDDQWRQILRGINKDFWHQTVSSEQIENYLSEKAGIDLTEFFDQYLRQKNIPVLEYQLAGHQLNFRWKDVVEGFDMPIIVYINDTKQWIFPTSNFKTKVFDQEIANFRVDMNFLVKPQSLNL